MHRYFHVRRTAAGLAVLAAIAASIIALTNTSSAFVVAEEARSTSTADPIPDATADSSRLAAPDFTLRTLDGDVFRLSDQLGRVVVLNFWATWCPPCREEIPEFIELQDEFGKDRVLFVGVSLDHVGPGPVRDFTRQMEITYPIMIDDGPASEAYGPIASLPTTFLIGRDGQLEGYAYGMVTREMLEPLLEKLVAGHSLISGTSQ